MVLISSSTSHSVKTNRKLAIIIIASVSMALPEIYNGRVYCLSFLTPTKQHYSK
jgi:hypothetical protein